jgi:hypothetical protein
MNTLSPFRYAIAALLCGCAPMLMVPPTHLSQGESPRALRAGQVSAGGSYAGVGTFSGLFESGLSARMFSGETTVGLGGDMDLRVLASYASLRSEGEEVRLFGSSGKHIDYYEVTGFDRNVFATTLRLKWNPHRNPGWAMTLGGGLGDGLGQNFWSVEHAQIFGAENRFFIPYFNLKGVLSGPVDARKVTWNSTKYWPEYSKTPRTTLGLEAIMGFRLPLTDLRTASDRRRANHPFLRGEIGVLSLQDGDSTAIMGATASVALVFPLRR